jgi:hypothetical protein
MKSLSVFVFHPEYVLMNLTYVIELSNLTKFITVVIVDNEIASSLFGLFT